MHNLLLQLNIGEEKEFIVLFGGLKVGLKSANYKQTFESNMAFKSKQIHLARTILFLTKLLIYYFLFPLPPYNSSKTKMVCSFYLHNYYNGVWKFVMTTLLKSGLVFKEGFGEQKKSSVWWSVYWNIFFVGIVICFFFLGNYNQIGCEQGFLFGNVFRIWQLKINDGNYYINKKQFACRTYITQ